MLVHGIQDGSIRIVSLSAAFAAPTRLETVALPRVLPKSTPMRVGASAGSSENSKEGAMFNSVTVRQRLEYTKLWVMWAI